MSVLFFGVPLKQTVENVTEKAKLEREVKKSWTPAQLYDALYHAVGLNNTTAVDVILKHKPHVRISKELIELARGKNENVADQLIAHKQNHQG